MPTSRPTTTTTHPSARPTPPTTHPTVTGAPGPTSTSRALVTDHDGRILLLRPAVGHYDWQLPGGGAHYGESPLGCADRELREETGLHHPARCLLVIAFTHPRNPRAPGRIDYLFDYGTHAAASLHIRHHSRDIVDYQWARPHETRRLLHPAHLELLDLWNSRTHPGPVYFERPTPVDPDQITRRRILRSLPMTTASTASADQLDQLANTILVGGNPDTIPRQRRILYVDDHTDTVKIEDGNGRHHFTRTHDTTDIEGMPLQVFLYCRRTANAE